MNELFRSINYNFTLKNTIKIGYLHSFLRIHIIYEGSYSFKLKYIAKDTNTLFLNLKNLDQLKGSKH